MLTKAQVLKTLEDMPDTFASDDLIERIIFLEELQVALEQSKKGEVFDHDDVVKEILVVP